jgi:hypothetical protein
MWKSERLPTGRYAFAFTAMDRRLTSEIEIRRNLECSVMANFMKDDVDVRNPSPLDACADLLNGAPDGFDLDDLGETDKEAEEAFRRHFSQESYVFMKAMMALCSDAAEHGRQEARAEGYSSTEAEQVANMVANMVASELVRSVVPAEVATSLTALQAMSRDSLDQAKVEEDAYRATVHFAEHRLILVPENGSWKVHLLPERFEYERVFAELRERLREGKPLFEPHL